MEGDKEVKKGVWELSEEEQIDPFIFHNTFVKRGRFKAIVCAIGSDTLVHRKEINSPFQSILIETEVTAISAKISRINGRINFILLITWILLLLIYIASYFTAILVELQGILVGLILLI